MKTLNVREMRSALTRLDELIAKEGEIVVTRRGRGIARLLPISTHETVASHGGLRAKMRRLKVPSEDLIRRDRDRG